MTRLHNLVDTDWLEAHLDDPEVRIVDMRGKVITEIAEPGEQRAEYRGNHEAYRAGHIPGAVYIDWTKDIVDQDDSVPAQIALPEQFARAMEERGIGDDHLVIAYDDHDASQFATRLWWALRYYGHAEVRVLDGGWKRWLREGRPVSMAVPSPPAATFTPRVQPDWRVTAEQVMEGLGAGGKLVDARDRAQYTGAIRRGPRGGHIPGAVHLPRERLMAADGTFQSLEEVRAVAAAAGLSPDQSITAYCNGGVAATTVLFALDSIGFPHLSNYDGSWNEWSTRNEMPVETEDGGRGKGKQSW